MDDSQAVQDQNLVSDDVASQVAGTTLMPADISPPATVVNPTIPPSSDPLIETSPGLPPAFTAPPATDTTPSMLPPDPRPPADDEEESVSPLEDPVDTSTAPTLGPTRFSFDDPAQTTSSPVVTTTAPTVPPLSSEPPATPSVPEPTEEFSPLSQAAPSPPAISLSDVPPISDSEIAEFKQEDLGELTPLVDRLDLDPEKLYDIIMEIIQASGDNKLLKPAYEAARRISDPDLKAKALLEVVNEIDYFNRPKE